MMTWLSMTQIFFEELAKPANWRIVHADAQKAGYLAWPCSKSDHFTVADSFGLAQTTGNNAKLFSCCD